MENQLEIFSYLALQCIITGYLYLTSKKLMKLYSKERTEARNFELAMEILRLHYLKDGGRQQASSVCDNPVA